jgi:hypothetical protein
MIEAEDDSCNDAELHTVPTGTQGTCPCAEDRTEENP